MSDDQQRFDWQLFVRLLGLARPYRGLFALCGFLAIILAPLSTLQPWLINQIVDNQIASSDIAGLVRMSIVFVAVLLVTGLVQYIFVYATARLGQSVIRDLRVRVFRHITSLNLSHFDRTPIGRSTTRTINDIETINTVFSQGVITIVADVLTLITVLVVMFITSVKLTLICLITMPLIVYATYVFKTKVKKAYQVVRTQISRMNAFLQERITGMHIVQIFNAEKQEMEQFKKINREYTQANLDSILYYAVFFPVVEIIAAASLGLMVWWGARGVLGGDVTLGALIAFPIYLNMLFRPMRMLADKFNTLQMGLVAADRIFGVLDNESRIENQGTQPVAKLQGEVRFQDVFFSYDGETDVIKGLSFTIEPGKSLAIVGSTGSGKTTIINILNRFYEIRSGSITIDGVRIQEYELNALRQRIAMVLQDVFLFTGTVLENITLMDPEISRETVLKASKTIGAHPFIEQLPGGYDYVVTERGNNLSMGQRQLISFVRALVYDPDILVLDEATSSIDSETEAIIQHAIEMLIEKRTSIIIAHRLSTIRHVDKILVLDHGRCVELGSHEELLSKESGHYKKLYEIQFAHTAGVDV
ncbi:MAG: ABC transporter ATP-binding protein [Saprospiraceae bacterium]|nr:ABC transporter ATP-binding protein [Saprospiraceae bacterium]